MPDIKDLKVLVISKNPSAALPISKCLLDIGADYLGRFPPDQVLPVLSKKKPDLAIMDSQDGCVELIRRIRNCRPIPRLLVVLPQKLESTKIAVSAIKAGAWDCIIRPISRNDLGNFLNRLVLQPNKGVERGGLITDFETVDGITRLIWKSDAMNDILTQISKIVTTDANVFINGESGTGKELIAKLIYANSLRNEANFVPINCASLPENLLETEFFGHEKGAFTGALTKKKGLFEYADGGTVFLDEISEMSPNMQAKLLRFLEDGSFRRVGGTELLTSDVRILAATNLPPMDAVRQEKLRADLYYRLSMIKISIPPLRERPEDIREIFNYYLKRVGDDYGKRIEGIDEAAFTYLLKHSWPGNIRELRNVVYQLIYMSRGTYITLEDLQLIKFPMFNSKSMARTMDQYKLEKEQVIRQFHKDYFGFLIQKYQGNMSKVAQIAGISRTALYNIISKMDL